MWWNGPFRASPRVPFPRPALLNVTMVMALRAMNTHGGVVEMYFSFVLLLDNL